MGLFDIFISEREKTYRRTTLAHKFDAALEDYLSDDNCLESFMSSVDRYEYVFISYSPLNKSVSIRSKKNHNSHLLIDTNQSINLCVLSSFEKLKDKFKYLKNNNFDLNENYYQLSECLCDLITEAVIEFEKHFSLPKAD